MKLRLPRRRIARVAIYLVSLFLILIAADLMLVQVRRTIHPAYDTTRILAPTLPDGSIDYLTAIEDYFSRGVTNDNNAAIPMLQALGRAALPKNQPPDGITDRLGMQHMPEKGDYYITSEDYFKAHPTQEDFDPGSDFTWPLTIGPDTRAWVQANDKPLNLLVEASKRSRFFMPFNGGNRPRIIAEILLPHIGLLNNATRALLTRALIRLDAGDVAGFQQDIGASHRLARLFEQDATIVTRLVGIAQEDLTCRVERLGIASGKIPAQQLQDLLADLDRLGDQPISADCIDAGERYMGLDFMQAMAHADPAGQAALFDGILSRSEPKVLFRFLPIPIDQCMREMNQCYDAEIISLQQPTFAQRIHAQKLFNEQMAAMAAENGVTRFFSADWPAVTFLPSMVAYSTKIDTSRTQVGLTKIALGLAIFKSEHGTYPATLSELASQNLLNIPDDIFSDQPLKYSRTRNAYTLYSVGPNMTDDGGKTTKPGDDITANEIFRTFSHPGAPISPATQK